MQHHFLPLAGDKELCEVQKSARAILAPFHVVSLPLEPRGIVLELDTGQMWTIQIGEVS